MPRNNLLGERTYSDSGWKRSKNIRSTYQRLTLLNIVYNKARQVGSRVRFIKRRENLSWDFRLGAQLAYVQQFAGLLLRLQFFKFFLYSFCCPNMSVNSYV